MFEFKGTQINNGFPFVGYRMIKGIPLTRELIAGLDSKSRRQLVAPNHGLRPSDASVSTRRREGLWSPRGGFP